MQPEQDYNQRTQVLHFESLESDQQQLNHRWPSNRNFFAHEILGLDRAVYTSEIIFPALISRLHPAISLRKSFGIGARHRRAIAFEFASMPLHESLSKSNPRVWPVALTLII
jgi:hypothetical protein